MTNRETFHGIEAALDAVWYGPYADVQDASRELAVKVQHLERALDNVYSALSDARRSMEDTKGGLDDGRQ